MLITRRQKLVVDAEGIHYAERKGRKLVWRHYYWKDVECCYFNYEIRYFDYEIHRALNPFAFRQLYILTTDGMGWKNCKVIELVDFELAFMLSHLKQAIVSFSGDNGIIDEEKTSAKKKACLRVYLLPV